VKRHIYRHWGLYTVIFYVLVGVMTFGHNAARYDRVYAQDRIAYRQCLLRVTTDDDKCGFAPRYDGFNVVGSFVAGLAWPLYWTWVEFDRLEGVAV
jgi:hypothetical protein